VTITYRVHITDVLDESRCEIQKQINNATADGKFQFPDPIGTRDLTQLSDTTTVAGKHIAIQKTASPNNAKPGDLITFTINFQVSDFATVSSLVLNDHLVDGYTFVVTTGMTVNGSTVPIITPSVTINNDGTTDIQYDITAATGESLASGTTGTITFTATIDQFYNDGTSPILARDSLKNKVLGTYKLTAGAEDCMEDSNASVAILPITISKTIINPKSEYQPGNKVTFHLEMEIPSGDTQDIVFEDFFPLPVFDVTTINPTFGSDIRWAANDTLHLPLINLANPTITIDSATNQLKLTWSVIDTSAPQILAVDVDVTVQSNPFADDLFLTNLFQTSTNNSPLQSVSSTTAAQLHVRAPVISKLTKGVSATSGVGAISPSGTPVDGDLTGADAGDTVTFVLTAQNTGGAPAYDMTFTDDTPSVLTGCTVNSVKNGSGNNLTYTGNLFTATSLKLDSPLPVNDTALVTYTCTIANGVNPRKVIDNTAALTWASDSGATPFPKVEDSASVTIAGPAIAKTIGSISPQGAGSGKVTAGDTVIYQIQITLPEGTTPGLQVTDTLPNGFQYVANSVTVDTTGFGGSVPTPTVSGTGPITINFGDVTVTNDNNAGNNTFIVTLQALVLDNAANSATSSPQKKTNNVALTYTGITGNPVTASVDTEFAEPKLTMTKAMSPETGLKAGDTVTVTLTVANTGTSPAYDITVSDPLPSGLFDLTTSVNDVTPTPSDFPYAYNYNTGTGTVTYTGAGPLAVGGSATFKFTAKVKADAVTGSSYTNTATATGDGQSGKVTGERSTNGSDTKTATTTRPGRTKSVVSTSQNFTDPGDMNKNANPPVAIGERVTYALTFTLPPGQTNHVTLADAITSDGGIGEVSLVSATLKRSATTLTAANDGAIGWSGLGPVAVTNLISTVGAPTQEFQLVLGTVNNTDTVDATYTLTVELRIANVATNAAGNTITDIGRLRYQNVLGTAQSVSTNKPVNIHVALPVVQVTKIVDKPAPAAGETVTYTLTIRNNATDTNAATGFDWVFADTLPADLENPVITSSNEGTAVGASVVRNFSGNTLSGTIDQLDPGKSIIITYTARVKDTTPFGKTITNTATATATTIKNTSPVDLDEAGERTGAGGVDNLADSDHASLTTQTPTLSKAVLTTQHRYAIGDLVQYQLTISVNKGQTTNLVVSDTLPVGLAYFTDDSHATTITSSNGITASGTTNASGNPITFTFPTVMATTTGSIAIQFWAQVQNVSSNQDGVSRTNTAGAVYDNPNNPGSQLTVKPNLPLPEITVGEPNLTMTKTILSGATGSQAGDTIQYQFTVKNEGATTAYQMAVSDVLPAGIDNITGVSVSTSGGNIQQNNAGCASGDLPTASISATNNNNDTLTLSNLCIVPGATLTVTYNAVLMDIVQAGQTLTNPVHANYASQPTGTSSTAVVRDNANNASTDGPVNDTTTPLNNYGESASTPLTVAAPIAIDKQADKTQATIGETVTYTLKVSVIEGVTPSVVVTDVLPVGLSYVSHTISVGHSGMTLGNTSYNTQLGTGQTVQFNLGDVSNPANESNTDDYVTVAIVARVDNRTANQSGDVLKNGENGTVTVQYGTTPTTVTYDYETNTSGIQGRPLTITEPALEMTKMATPTAQALGDVVTFTITVQNTGTAPAFDLVIGDTLPTGLTYVSTSASLPSADVTVSSQSLTFRISTLANGSSTSFTYQARVDTSATVGVDLINDAQLTWKSLSGATGSADSGRTGPLNGADTPNNYATTASTPVTPTTSAVIDATKTVVDPTNDVAQPGDTLKYTVVLKNTGSSTVDNVVFTDSIPANTTYVTGSSTLDDNVAGSFSNPTLTVNVGTLNVGSSATITFQVKINVDVPTGTVISNQGVVDSDQTVPEPTDVDGNDTNGDQPTEITVGGTPTPVGVLYAEKQVRLYTDTNNNGIVDTGDVMEYTLTLHNQGSTALTNVRLTDTLPTGLAYVTNSALAPTGTQLTVTGSNLLWESTTAGTGFTLAPNSAALATFRVTVLDATVNSGTFSNQATVNYADGTTPKTTQTDSNGSTEDGNQPTVFQAGSAVEPKLDVQKRWQLDTDADDNGQPSAGDTLYYTITINNTGAATAMDVRLNDSIPDNTTIVVGSVFTSQGTVLGEDQVSINIGSITTGGVVTVNFKVKIDQPLADGISVISNQATVTRTGDATGVKSDDNGNPDDGLNPTLTPVGGQQSAVTKALIATSEADSTDNNVLIGEVLTYQLTVNIPPGTTRQLAFVDTLPAGLNYVVGSAQLKRTFATGLNASLNPGVVNSADSGKFVSLTSDSNLSWDSNTQTLQLDLGDIINSDANNASYTLEYQAVVQNISTNIHNKTLLNKGGIRYWNALSQTQTTFADPVVTVKVIEPHLTLTKTPNPSAILAVAGGQFTYTIQVKNTGNAPAYDVDIADVLAGQLPTNVQLIDVTPQVQSGAFGTITNNSSTSSPASIAVNVSSFPVDGVLEITATLQTTADLDTNVTSFGNTATAAWTSLPGDKGTGNANPNDPSAKDGERTGGTGTGSNGYNATDTATVVVGNPGLTKELVSPATPYAIGDLVEYRLTISIPAGADGVHFTVNDVVLQDVLPVGLAYVAGSFTLQPGSVTLGNTPTDFTDTGNTLSANFGTVTNRKTTSQMVIITYQARVENALTNQKGKSLANQATLSLTNPGTGNSFTTSPVSQSITVGEPHLVVVKDVTPTVAVQNGDTLTYTVTVANDGNTTAYETQLTDTLLLTLVGQDSSLTVTTLAGTPSVTASNFAFGATGLSTTTPFALAPNESFQLTFKAKLTGATAGDALPNAVKATFSSRAVQDGNQRDSSGDADQDDSAQATDPNKLNNYNTTANSPSLVVASTVAINKVFSPQGKTTYTIGEPVVYQIKVNVSRVITPAMSVTDVLPAGLSFVSCQVTTGDPQITIENIATLQTSMTDCQPSTLQGTGPTTITFDLGDVDNQATDGNPNDEYVLITLTARVDNISGNQANVSLGNNASVSYTDAGQTKTLAFDADGDPSNGIQPLNLRVVEPQVALAKTANANAISLGDEVIFSWTLTPDVDATGQCQTPAYDLVVRDTLPANLEYVGLSGSPPPGDVTVTQSGQQVTFTLTSALACGSPRTIAFRAKVLPTATVGAPLTNNAILTWASQPGATGDPDSGRTGAGGPLNDYTATDTAAVAPSASAVITALKTVAIFTDVNHNGKANPGDTLEYTVTLTNTSADSVDNVIFTDPIPSNTEYVTGSSTLNGSPAGSFSDDILSVPVGTLNPRAQAVIVFRVTIDWGTPNGFVISNQGVVDSDQTVPTPTDADGDPNNGAQPTTIPVGGQSSTSASALRAEKQVAVLNDVAPTGVVSPGDTLRYTIVLSNSGTTDLTGLTLTDPIPAGLTYVSSSPTATLTGTTLTWTNLSVPANGSLTLTFDAKIDSFTDAERIFSNQGTVYSPQVGSVLTDGNGDPSDGAQPTVIVAVTTTGSGAPNLDLQKRWSLVGNAAGGTEVNPGDIVRYTLVVSNTGSAAANDVRIVEEDTLPSQVTFISGSVLTSSGILVSENPLIVNVGTLNPGAQATVSFRVEVNPGTAGQTASNRASVTSNNAPKVLSDNDGDPDNGLNPTQFPIRAPTVPSIPTLSEWGMTILSLLMLLALGATRRRVGR